MQLLKDRILTDGVVKEGNILKVDSFLNHQMDIALFNEMGKEFKRLFADCKVNKMIQEIIYLQHISRLHNSILLDSLF